MQTEDRAGPKRSKTATMLLFFDPETIALLRPVQRAGSATAASAPIAQDLSQNPEAIQHTLLDRETTPTFGENKTYPT